MRKSGICFLLAVCLLGMVGCGKKEPVIKLEFAPEKEVIEVNTYNAEAYLRPIWYTREMYNETAMFIGKEGECTLLYEPSEILSVRNYELDITYIENKDYTISGNKIKRTANSAMPYFEPDEYFLEIPESISIAADMEKVEFDFTKQRYLKYGETTTFTLKQVAVSYKHNQKYKGLVPASASENFAPFLNKLKTDKAAKVLFYGDSITVGCNASGTSYGGNINPHTPSWPNIVCDELGKAFEAKIEYVNHAVGGWQTSNGAVNFADEVLDEDADLLVLAFGMNDSLTNRVSFEADIWNMTTKYLKDKPSGCVLLVSCMLPNTQSSWVGNQKYFEENLYTVAQDYDAVAVAPVNRVFKDIESTGKRTRDYLANNINHPNDFGVRIYAQVILKTILGSTFCEEVYVAG